MSSTKQEALFGKTLEQLKEICRLHGWPAYSARQMADWLYKHQVTEIADMTNLSKKIRHHLQEHYIIGRTAPLDVRVAADGTKKYLFPAGHQAFIETAYIPDKDRHTLCISSQVGCKMGCRFCMTGRQGFQGQLSSGEILNQIQGVPEHDRLTNIVYMGMGEPLDNLDAVMESLEILTADYGYAMSPRRITVSTIGILPAMITFLEKSRCHLAISLHSPFEEERKKLIPMEKANSLQNIIAAIRPFTKDKQRHISFEYIVFQGLNHSQEHVKGLAKLLGDLRCRINLIRFHGIPDSELKTPTDETMHTFEMALEEKGLTTTIRRSRGEDIQAACGLLSTQATK